MSADMPEADQQAAATQVRQAMRYMTVTAAALVVIGAAVMLIPAHGGRGVLVFSGASAILCGVVVFGCASYFRRRLR